jgi:hypothetical protein
MQQSIDPLGKCQSENQQATLGKPLVAAVFHNVRDLRTYPRTFDVSAKKLHYRVPEQAQRVFGVGLKSTLHDRLCWEVEERAAVLPALVREWGRD